MKICEGADIQLYSFLASTTEIPGCTLFLLFKPIIKTR
jgi:hypothetical protein